MGTHLKHLSEMYYAAFQLGSHCSSKYSKTCVKRPLSKILNIGFQDCNYRLMQVKSIAECSMNILQYFWP